MTFSAESRRCLSCGNLLKGRSDKKFCTDYCRNAYNNQLRSNSNNLVRRINNALGKNRRILQRILPEKEETARASKEKLLQSGFQFRYITHTYITQTGKMYLYCYDYGYLPLEGDWYLIVRMKGEGGRRG